MKTYTIIDKNKVIQKNATSVAELDKSDLSKDFEIFLSSNADSQKSVRADFIRAELFMIFD